MKKDQQNLVWVASFDIGKKNFSFCIEEFSSSELYKIKNLEKSCRLKKDFSPTKEYTDILDKIYKNGKVILYKNSDLRLNTNDKEYYDIEYCFNMTKLLDEYKSFWDKCSVFIVEQQMSFRGKINTMALKLGQHCISYFIINYNKFKIIMEFPAYHKTNVLAAERTLVTLKNGNVKYKKLGDKERKNWSIKKGEEILRNRCKIDETEKAFLDLYEPKKKKKGITKIKMDDLSDCLLMIQAFKYLAYVSKEI
jgi:hypothetical protein